MRLIFALIYIAAGIWLYISLGGDNLHPYIGIGFGFALMFSSVVVCNEGFFRRLKGQSDEEYIYQLLEDKKANIESFNVSDAITFEDLNTGCLCHLLSISRDRSICLYGQYLYEHAEINDDPELIQERSFPTTEFKLVRNLKNNDVLRLEVGNTVLAETKVEEINLNNLYDLGFQIEDGEIVDGVEFSKIRAACGI